MKRERRFKVSSYEYKLVGWVLFPPCVSGVFPIIPGSFQAFHSSLFIIISIQWTKWEQLKETERSYSSVLSHCLKDIQSARILGGFLNQKLLNQLNEILTIKYSHNFQFLNFYLPSLKKNLECCGVHKWSTSLLSFFWPIAIGASNNLQRRGGRDQ